MTYKDGIPFDELPEELQELLVPAATKDAKHKRRKKPGLREQRVLAVSKVLNILHTFTLPQQRAILKFAMYILEQANKRWSNDTVREGENHE